MKNISGVFFDLDGTLVDSAKDLAVAVEDAMRTFEKPVPSVKQVSEWIGNGTARLVKRALTNSMDGEPDAQVFERAKAIFDQSYEDNVGTASCLFPGVLEALEGVKAGGLPMAVITNKPYQFTLQLLQQFGIESHFSAILGGDSLPVTKPDPGPLIEAARRMGVNVEDCLMAGDSQHDIKAARNAGCSVIAVSYGYNHGEDIRLAGADATVDSLAEILGIVFPA